MPQKFIPHSQKNLKLASEWHPSKNGPITPDDVVAGTNNFAWWICEKGHEWEYGYKNYYKFFSGMI